MKLSLSLLSLLLSSSLALSFKRQNDIPSCIEGDASDVGGPYQSGAECEDECYMTEKQGDRVGQICKGYCDGTPLVTGGVVYNCFVKE